MRRRFIKTTSSKLSQFDINNYITIEALEDNLTISVWIGGGRAYYGIDGIGWNEYEYMSEILLNRGQTISFKGTNVKSNFYIDKSCNILGNGYSLLAGDNAVNITDISVFGNQILSFLDCPIIKVASGFLPATTLAEYCYYRMFRGCTSLTTAPDLPATTLARSCYSHMFYGCTSLTTAPDLPATTLTEECYQYMFHNCSKLNYIKMLATNISAFDCLSVWVYGVSSTGTFVKNPNMTSLPTGDSGIPSGWTVVNDGEENNEAEKLITFYIKSANPEQPLLERKATSGMTWGEWVLSDFNLMYENIEDNGFSFQYFEDIDGDIFHYDEGWAVSYVEMDSSQYVKSNDIIEDNFIYKYCS